jgi:uncharacterized protein GlcG (DUF336 family)
MSRAARRCFRIALTALLCVLMACCLLSCGGSSSGIPSLPGFLALPLTAAEVQQVVEKAAQSVDAPLVIAVADRAGNILAVFRNATAPAVTSANFGVSADSNEVAVALARTAALFSNDQAPLSSRTVRFISGIHFPPGVTNASNGDLYGIENTNRGCPLNISYNSGSAISPSRSIGGASLGLGILTGKADLNDSNPNAVNPGGVPLFKAGHAVGGVGVVSSSASIAEYAAFAGASQSGFLPTTAQLPPPGVVIIGGISLPFVDQTTAPAGVGVGSGTGSFVVGPTAGALPPDGDLVTPVAGALLTAADVSSIIQHAVSTAQTTRAVIRLPQGSRARMTIAVADLDGTIIGLRRMPDATVFSVDVAVSKARNVIYFSSSAGAIDLPGLTPGTAITNRTIGFGAQPLFTPGIDGSSPGPFFNLFLNDSANPCTQGSQPPNPNQSGIVFFPGSVPLYKNGVLVGGLGVSGDGVDQDDYVTNGGAQGFDAPLSLRADQQEIGGVRMPYLKFPRNPTQ